jgi:deoxyribodipyrimidine photo-lyase
MSELASVDDAWIHTPWQMPVAIQRRCGVRVDVDYPAPLVDHERAARLARQRIQAARRGGEARRQSRAIYQRHGSRRGRAVLHQRELFADSNDGT